MYKRLTLKNISNFKIDYEYRHNRVLLMFTNFDPIKYTEFADALTDKCTQIHSVEKLIRYDEKTGAIIITMKVGYDEAFSNKELHKAFHSFFTSSAV